MVSDMKAMVWHSRKNDRAARRALFKNNMVYYLLLLTGCMAMMMMLHELTSGLVRAAALAGIILSLAAMLGTLAMRALLDHQAARDTRANKPALIEYHFGTKFITRKVMPLAEAHRETQPLPEDVHDKLAYSDIRALKQDGSYLYLFRSNKQPPLAIGLGTEGIEQIKGLLTDRTNCKHVGRI